MKRNGAFEKLQLVDKHVKPPPPPAPCCENLIASTFDKHRHIIVSAPRAHCETPKVET